ncbi:response regulator [Paenibacillus protaetiae]|uniref:Response regulator n=1 Tax=Paenibacillus protaetiae TaxID=2509456 RepID=A0A4V0YFJ9_9BACL|nr:response regulator [Paenibacillus protaetiae]QAY67971.1 response regulator [Paenibacillus protaetiae]
MNILIADDENIIREGIQRTLVGRFPEHTTYLASNAEEAIAILRACRIDIALTDILMPGMTGLEMINLTRSQYPHVRWVVISAYSEFAYAQEAMRLGAKDYLLKPIGKEMLVEIMEKLGAEIQEESEATEEAELLRMNRKFVREAVFQRFSSGLDIGRFDMKPLMESYPRFHLIMVKMDTDKVVQLEHFIIENVMGELIEQYGSGFVTTHDRISLLGLVAVQPGRKLDELLEELRKNLVKYLKVPFQIMHTEQISDIQQVPREVQRMRQASTTQVYEHNASGGGDQLIEVALQYIRTHYQEELSLEKVASVVYLNPVYFSQLFKQKTGSGFKEHVIQIRLEQAKQLLLNPKLKLADVADRIGYQDIRHFSQLFRKKYGETPSEFRSKNLTAAGTSS